jgi:hypothetical protein
MPENEKLEKWRGKKYREERKRILNPPSQVSHHSVS